MNDSIRAKTRISITILPNVNDMLELVSKKTGKSKSLIAQQAIAVFLKDQLDKDSKELAKMNFSDLPTEDEWIELQSNI